MKHAPCLLACCFHLAQRIEPNHPSGGWFFICHSSGCFGMQLLPLGWNLSSRRGKLFICGSGSGKWMQITLNGKRVELAEDVQTVRELLANYQLLEKIVVVEHNSEIIDRSQYDGKTIADGDRIEIVHFVGGG
jgi:sulfur carrier protein